MKTETLFPDAPAVVVEGGRRFVEVPWDEADCLRETLSKHRCPTTLCLDPEARQARLELWPGVTPEAVRAVLDARRSDRRVRTTAMATPAGVGVRGKTPDPADLICV
jgi:hypothetical protein